MNANTPEGSRIRVVTTLLLLLLVVTVVVIQMIQKADTAGKSISGEMGQMPPAAVIVTTVEVEKTRERTKATGFLKALSRSDVATQETGAVLEMPVDEGDEVHKGDTLAILDSRRIRAQIVEGKARLTTARNLLLQRRAEVSRAQSDYEMKAKLRPSNAVSQSTLLDSEKALAVAKSQADSALEGIAEGESRLELLNIRLNDLKVTAPFEGIVVSKSVEPGEWVSAGQTVASILAIDPIEAWLKVPARYLGRAARDRENFQVRQSSTGNLYIPEKVIAIPDIDPRSQLFPVIATLRNDDGRLQPGESVTGIIPIGRSTTYLKVPTNAIVRSPMGVMVLIIQAPAEGQKSPTGRPVPVQIAFQRDGYAFIAAKGSGLNVGDQVIVEGNQNLRPGQPVMIKPKENVLPAGSPTSQVGGVKVK